MLELAAHFGFDLTFELGLGEDERTHAHSKLVIGRVDFIHVRRAHQHLVQLIEHVVEGFVTDLDPELLGGHRLDATELALVQAALLRELTRLGHRWVDLVQVMGEHGLDVPLDLARRSAFCELNLTSVDERFDDVSGETGKLMTLQAHDILARARIRGARILIFPRLGVNVERAHSGSANSCRAGEAKQGILLGLVNRCPWCGASFDPRRDECAVCSRRPGDQPAQKPQLGGAGDLPIAIDFDLDVDGDEAPRKKGELPVSPAASPQRAVGGGGKIAVDSDDLLALDVGLEDEQPVARSRPNAAPPSSARGPEHDRGGSEATSALTPDLAEIPEYEVAALAGYGAPPFEWVTSVSYAFRVLRRRYELQQLLARVRIESEAGRRGVQGRMVALLEAVHARHPTDEALAVVVRPVHDMLSQLSAQTASLANAAERHRADVAALEADLAVRNLEKEQLVPERRTARVFVEDGMSKLGNAKAELARLSRDVTAAHTEATRAAGQSEFAPPEHARRIADLEAQQARSAAAVTEAERTLGERRVQLGGVEQRIAQAERATSDVHGRRKALDQRATAERKQAEQAIRSADFQRLDACEGALRRIVSTYGDRLSAAESTRFGDIESEHKRFEREVKRHELAVRAFSSDALARGLGLVLGAVALLVLAVVQQL